MFRLVKNLIIAAALVLSSGAAAQVAARTVSPSELEAQVAARLDRVEQFRFIREEALKRGLRVYLFGGTAAGFAHYVKWDLQRERGDTRYQADRFDYDYTNIYRSTQDLDVVVDGDVKTMNELAEIVKARFPHVQGSKSQWEFRPLRTEIGRPGEAGFKEAILGSHDFMNQHTDSNSTGLIELTRPPKGEPIVRDVRDWTSSPSRFLKDTAEGKIHYYFSSTHETTARSRAGDNPPLFSAIRFLTKAFQFELEMSSIDLAKIEKIVSDFDAGRDLKSPRAQSWLLKNGKKLVQHAVDVETALNWIGLLGVDTKLSSLDDPRTEDSLSWWLHKKPLASNVVGRGSGKTAGELQLHTVAHETNSMVALESITRSPLGRPNVFVSRSGSAGELAMLGEGFYTRIGREGAMGTGWTIRFEVDPRAREGTDFERVANDFVVFHNKNALRVIPESLNMNTVEFFEKLAKGEKVSFSDRGLFERARARVRTKSGALKPIEISNIDQLVTDAIERRQVADDLYQEWLLLPSSQSKLAIKKKLVLARLVENRMDQIAPELLSLDLTFEEAKALAYGPAIEIDMSVAYRRKALGRATSSSEVLSLMKPLRQHLGKARPDGSFQALQVLKPSLGGPVRRIQIAGATPRAYLAPSEMEFAREAAHRLWSLGVLDADLNRVVLSLEVKAQQKDLALALIESAPDARAASAIVEILHKMVLQSQFNGTSEEAMMFTSAYDRATKIAAEIQHGLRCMEMF